MFRRRTARALLVVVLTIALAAYGAPTSSTAPGTHGPQPPADPRSKTRRFRGHPVPQLRDPPRSPGGAARRRGLRRRRDRRG